MIGQSKYSIINPTRIKPSSIFSCSDLSTKQKRLTMKSISPKFMIFLITLNFSLLSLKKITIIIWESEMLELERWCSNY